MTEVGKGGVVITKWQMTPRFDRDYQKLSPELRQRLRDKLNDLLKNPRPRGLQFEKLKGYRRPDIYTIHITGNYKVSLEIQGDLAILRRVACHDEIDRRP